MNNIHVGANRRSDRARKCQISWTVSALQRPFPN